MRPSWTQEWVHNCGNRPSAEDGLPVQSEATENDSHLVKSVSNCVHNAALSAPALYDVPTRPLAVPPTKPVAWQGPSANGGGYVSKATHKAAQDSVDGDREADTPINVMEQSGLMVGTGTCFAGGVSVRLQNMDLWQSFSNIGTEMVINRSGRYAKA